MASYDNKKKDDDMFSMQNETMRECFEMYKQWLGVRSIRKRVDYINEQQQQDQRSNDKSSSSSKHKQQIQQIMRSFLNQQNPSPQANSLSPLQSHYLTTHPTLQQKQYQINQLISLNTQITSKQQQMLHQQSLYKQLMKKHYKFINNNHNKLQDIFIKFVKDKLLKNIQNVEHQMQEVYQIGGRSSISSSSFGAGKYAVEDWVAQQKQEKILKEQEKIYNEINQLEKQLALLQ